MDPAALVVPAIASVALGGALLVPIRDGRSGRKATLRGHTPLTADFRSIAPLQEMRPDRATSTRESPSRHTTALPLADAQHSESFDGESTAQTEAETAVTDRARSDCRDLPDDAAEFARILAAVEAASAQRSNAPDDVENAATVAARDGSNERTPPEARRENRRGSVASHFASSLRVLFDRIRTPYETRTTLAVEHAVETESIVERSFATALGSLFPDTNSPAVDTCASDAGSSALIHPIEDGPCAEAKRTTFVGDAVSARGGIERAVPVTRLPLRIAAREITWPAFATPPVAFATEAERYAYLRRCAVDAAPGGDALLARAFREETVEGRKLTLAALSRTSASAAAIDTFVFALLTGSDEERSSAIDALAESGSTAELTRGLHDRIDAIAAKAALAYVGTTCRDDYRGALAPFLDAARIDVILTMLAGVVE